VLLGETKPTGEEDTDLESLTWDYPGKTQPQNSTAGFQLDEITVVSWTICKQEQVKLLL